MKHFVFDVFYGAASRIPLVRFCEHLKKEIKIKIKLRKTKD